jgi:hypothetical protein
MSQVWFITGSSRGPGWAIAGAVVILEIAGAEKAMHHSAGRWATTRWLCSAGPTRPVPRSWSVGRIAPGPRTSLER